MPSLEHFPSSAALKARLTLLHPRGSVTRMSFLLIEPGTRKRMASFSCRQAIVLRIKNAVARFEFENAAASNDNTPLPLPIECGGREDCAPARSHLITRLSIFSPIYIYLYPYLIARNFQRDSRSSRRFPEVRELSIASERSSVIVQRVKSSYR